MYTNTMKHIDSVSDRFTEHKDELDMVDQLKIEAQLAQARELHALNKNLETLLKVAERLGAAGIR